MRATPAANWQSALQQAAGLVASAWLSGSAPPQHALAIALRAAADAQQWRWALHLFQDPSIHGALDLSEAVMQACSLRGQWPQVLQLFWEAAAWGQPLPFGAFHAALASLRRSRLWMLAADVLRQMQLQGFAAPRAYNEALGCGFPWAQALRLYAEMAARRALGTARTFVQLIQVCGAASEWQQALGVFDEMCERGHSQSTIGCNAVMTACKMGRQWQRALHFYEQMHRSMVLADVVTCSACISALDRGSQWERACQLLLSMLTFGPEPNLVSFNACISSCSAAQWQVALALVGRLKASGLQADDFTDVATLSALPRWQISIELLGASRRRSTECQEVYNAITGNFDRAGRWQQVLALLPPMYRAQLQLSRACLVSALRSLRDSGAYWERSTSLVSGLGLANMGSNARSVEVSAFATGAKWGSALRLFCQTREVGIQPQWMEISAAMSACDSGPQWPLAVKMLALRGVPAGTDVSHFNAAVSACQEGSCWIVPLAALIQLREVTLKPDTLTMNSVLTCCEKSERWQEGFKILEQFSELRLSVESTTLTASAATLAAGSFWQVYFRNRELRLGDTAEYTLLGSGDCRL
ncbi:unnamed protein product [Symbiodinium sp. CCMP2592]|nr:unnamed protein product [Symbiodinium sp. CCMP2592]